MFSNLPKPLRHFNILKAYGHYFLFFHQTADLQRILLKGTGFEREKALTVLGLFDNYYSKYFIFKIIFRMQWLF